MSARTENTLRSTNNGALNQRFRLTTVRPSADAIRFSTSARSVPGARCSSFRRPPTTAPPDGSGRSFSVSRGTKERCARSCATTPANGRRSYIYRDSGGSTHPPVCAVGDDVNDIPMIRHAGLGVAMGHARPEVLAVADLITGGHNEDGVASPHRASLAVVRARGLRSSLSPY